MLVELGSDQTSLHNPFMGGYYPVQLSFEEARTMMVDDPPQFKSLVEESLCRHVTAVNKLAGHGMRFWDYGNAFLLEASRAGADVMKGEDTADGYKYPTYVQDIMGDIFSLGFGPYRWVCTSGKPSDLAETDKIAADVIKEVIVTLTLIGCHPREHGDPNPNPDPSPCPRPESDHNPSPTFEVLETAPELVAAQLRDNLLWIEKAGENKMVVGTQVTILSSKDYGHG